MKLPWSLVLASLTTATAAQAQAPIVIRFSHVVAVDTPKGQAAEFFKRRAEELTARYHVEGVPLIVVNGKYVTDVGKAGGHTELIQLINDLVASEKRH